MLRARLLANKNSFFRYWTHGDCLDRSVHLDLEGLVKSCIYSSILEETVMSENVVTR